MRRELSSAASYVFRILAPVFICLNAALALWLFGIDLSTDSDNTLPIFFAISLSTILLVLAWHLSRARRVWLEGDELIVEGFSEKIRFPLKNVEKVTATRFVNPEHVRIYFRSSEGIDKNVFFYPPYRWFRWWTLHPVAEEIRKLAHDAAFPGAPYLQKRPPTDWKKLALKGVGLAIFASVFAGSIAQLMKSSEPYRWSFEQVQANPEVMRQLGSPVESGWFVSGSISRSRNRGTAFLEYNVSGPKGSGSVSIKGRMANGVWVYERAGILFESGYVSFLDSED